MAADAVGRFGLLPTGSRVLCALSGGADSVCMTHLLASRAEALGITVAAAHFSHGLRPESADAERALCQRLCDRLDIPLFCGEGDTPAYAETHGLGIEEAARILRRRFLEACADRWQATAIATGHHLEDSAETLLLNLIRGSGAQGMQGIPPKAGRYIRPLLLDSKEEIEAYIAENGLEYARDPTNFHGDNARARLRREVFPTLTELNSAALRHLARTALDNWEQNAHFCAMAEAFASACGGDTRTALIEIAPLLALPEEAAVRALQFLQQRIGGRMLERPHLEAVFALCRSKDPSAQTHLPGSRACRRYGTLLLTVEAPEEAPAPCTVRPGETVGFGPWEVTLLPVEGECPPLTLRSRLPGDMIAMPYGSKSVKKLLIEKKVPKELRETIPILCDRENILAVASLCRAHLPDKKIPQIICRRKKI